VHLRVIIIPSITIIVDNVVCRLNNTGSVEHGLNMQLNTKNNTEKGQKTATY